MSTEFAHIRSGRLSDEVVTQITDAIASGRLGPGDKLPSQRELQEAFGAGRAAVLEALRMLETSGLVTVKRGARGGTFINILPEKKLGDALGLLVQLNEVTLPELAEFRKVIEGHAARALSTPRSRHLLPMMNAAVENLSRFDLDNTPAGWASFMEAEMECHLVLVKATQNRLMERMMMSLHAIIREHFAFVPSGYRDRVLADWRGILDAAAAGDADTACRILHVHIDEFAEVIRGQRQADGGPGYIDEGVAMDQPATKQ